MTDITAIVSALSSLKTAAEIAKLVRESDVSLAAAETKLRLADLIVALAEAKVQVVEVQEAMRARDERIVQLEAALNRSASVRRFGDAYYEVREDGKPFGRAYCIACWDSGHVLRGLVRHPTGMRACSACAARYFTSEAADLPQSI